MAVLKDLIVHGASRFLNKSYFDSLEADSGAFKKIIAKDATVTNATVMGLLDVTGELHTKSWSNSNIATIDGSFYITPTFGLQGGDTSTNTVTVAANSLSFTNSSGTNFNFDSLYLDGSSSAIAWTTSSKVIVTGEILKDGEWIPLGTLKGTLSTYSTTSVVINNITDAKGAAPATLAALVGSGLRYRNVKVSLISIYRESKLRPLGIFMTATGANGKTFLDIYGGNNAESSTYAGLSTPVLRIGNLKGLPAIQGVTPSGWGIYTTNGFFSGTIVSTKGKIGNFTLDTALHAGTNGGPTSVSGTTAGTYVGTDGFLNYASNTAYVKMTGGVITAVGAVIKGAITADSGTIGGITANSSYGLYTNSKTSTTSSNTGFLIHKDGAIYLGAYDSTSGVTSCPFQVTAEGSLTARSGRIGKFNLTNTYLYTGSGSTMAGMGGDQAFWAGNSSSSSAPFHVSYAGVLNATGATISGAITASSLTISSGATISGDGASQILNSELEGAINAAKEVATNYITQIDNNGIWVTPTGKKPTNASTGAGATGAKINADGMDIYKNGVSVAKYGDAARIGKENSSRFLINESSLEGYNSSNVKYFEVSGDNLIYGDNIAASTGELNDVRDDLANAQDGLNDKIDDYSAANDEKVDSLSDIVKGNSSSGMIGLVQRWSELDNYMEFGTYIEEGVTHPVLILGKKETNELTARLRNDILEFVNGETVLAYLSGDALHVQEKVSFGNFEMYQRNTGHLSIRYISGGDD